MTPRMWLCATFYFGNVIAWVFFGLRGDNAGSIVTFLAMGSFAYAFVWSYQRSSQRAPHWLDRIR